MQEAHANPIRNAAREIEHLVMVPRDITGQTNAEEERRQTEVQLRHVQKMESIAQLAAGIQTFGHRSLLELMARHPGRVKTITSDNGTEFHWYGQIEAVNPVKFYFATPHHSWERGTNENTNGLIRQYLPKGQSMKGVTQHKCDLIAEELNTRPRKRHAYKTPNQCFLRN